VWGGLQRRDDERPYPYGVYGTPNWFVNRDPARRKAYAQQLANGAGALKDLDKEHVWRSYDYPHVIMLYFHMYQIAKRYPEMSKYLDAAGYLNRAWETARAFYTYPYEIYPSHYETYKWGLYNELVVLEVIDALRAEGFASQATWLRTEWEKKTKYFVYDDEYPFRSEYAFDRTAFESSYAFAKYGATHDMRPDTNLWYDVKLKKWYSHPSVETRGLARIHGPTARLRTRRPRMAKPGVLHPRRGCRRQLHGGDGRVECARLRPRLRATTVRLAAARLRVVSQLVELGEHGTAGDELRILVSRPGERRRGRLAIHVGESGKRVDGIELSRRRYGAARSLELRRRN